MCHKIKSTFSCWMALEAHAIRLLQQATRAQVGPDAPIVRDMKAGRTDTFIGGALVRLKTQTIEYDAWDSFHSIYSDAGYQCRSLLFLLFTEPRILSPDVGGYCGWALLSAHIATSLVSASWNTSSLGPLMKVSGITYRRNDIRLIKK